MPIINGVYVSPKWVNNKAPALNAGNMNEIATALTQKNNGAILCIEFDDKFKRDYKLFGKHGDSYTTTINVKVSYKFESMKQDDNYDMIEHYTVINIVDNDNVIFNIPFNEDNFYMGILGLNVSIGIGHGDSFLNIPCGLDEDGNYKPYERVDISYGNRFAKITLTAEDVYRVLNVNEIEGNQIPFLRYLSDRGIADSYYSVGDVVATNIQYEFRDYLTGIISVGKYFDWVIIGFNHNSVLEGENRVHLASYYKSNNTFCVAFGPSSVLSDQQYTENFWENSEIYKKMNYVGYRDGGREPEGLAIYILKPYVENNLRFFSYRDITKNITKYSCDADGAINSVNNIFFVPSYTEIYGDSNRENYNISSNEDKFQKQYDLFKISNSKIGYSKNNQNNYNPYPYPIRSVGNYSGVGRFLFIDDDGNVQNIDKLNTAYVLFCFCV